MSNSVTARFVTPATSLNHLLATIKAELEVIRKEVGKELVPHVIPHLFLSDKYKTSYNIQFDIRSFEEKAPFNPESIYTGFHIKGKYYYLHIFNDITGHDLKDELGELTPHITISLGSDTHRATPELIKRFAFAVKEVLKCRVIFKDEAVSEEHTEL